jgi:serine/threonine protein kinase/Tfp pilus assembly protein PilF
MSESDAPSNSLTGVSGLAEALRDRYVIERELGRGGMATVYLAADLKHGRLVAIKLLRHELVTALGPERFLQEIQVTAGLQHPHILPLLDSGTVEGMVGGSRPYYVMPFVEGESLRDHLEREGQLSVDEAVRITCQVASALSYAHEHGVVHRDIKPENILLSGGHAVVADFGIARALSSTGAERLTESGLALGTARYMSPEQASGDPRLDGRTDIYALGCVLYEMLAGEPPYTGPTAHAIVAKRMLEPVPRIRSVRESVSEALEAAITRALAKIPADRFGTAADFARALARDATHDAPASHLRHGPRDRRFVALLGALITVAVIVGTVWRLRVSDGRDNAQRAAGPRTVAVFPFENLGPADDEYFSAGMTEEIATRLSSVSGISVVPRRASQQYAKSDMAIHEIGRKLGVDYIVVGSVRWAAPGSGSRNVRITLELIQARDERQLWATTYNRVIDDIFEVQSDIASQVIERLGVALPEDERARLRGQPTTNHEAYTLYLKGRYFWNKRTEKDIQIGLDYFRRAVDLDPGYSLAWVGIADGWIFRGWYSLLAPREAFPKAKAAALKALEFDSTLAEAHTSMAHILLEFDHDWDSAEREYRRGIQLSPRYPLAHHWYGGFLSAMGRHEEALQQAETARRLDPLSLIIQTWVGLKYYFARKYENAIAEYLKALELDPEFAPAHWHLGWAYEQVGQFDKGISEAEHALAIDADNLLYVASLGHAYARAGKVKEARATLARLARASAERHVSSYHVAVIYLALGDVETGLDWLERAREERSPWIGYMRVDPRLDTVRSHPRFERLLRDARLDF